MENILVLTHVDESGTALTKASLECVTAGVELAASLSAKLSIGVLGANVTSAAQALAGAASRVLSVSGDAFAQPRYVTDAAACEAICRASEATLILAPESSRFARVLPGVAYRLGGYADTHITGLNKGDTLEVTRWFYRQRIEAVLRRESRPWILLLESGTREAWAAKGDPVQVEEVAVTLPTLKTNVIGVQAPAQDQQTIRPGAKVLFVAGAGWTKKQTDGQAHAEEAEKLILGFLHSTDASLGSSKSLADQTGENQQVLRFLTHMNQVGQTGSTPRHPKGLATCCHGEEPHVVGWRFINERRAISLDPNCGWARGKADVVYVADAFKVIPKVNALLAEKK